MSADTVYRRSLARWWLGRTSRTDYSCEWMPAALSHLHTRGFSHTFSPSTADDVVDRQTRRAVHARATGMDAGEAAAPVRRSFPSTSATGHPPTSAPSAPTPVTAGPSGSRLGELPSPAGLPTLPTFTPAGGRPPASTCWPPQLSRTQGRRVRNRPPARPTRDHRASTHQQVGAAAHPGSV